MKIRGNSEFGIRKAESVNLRGCHFGPLRPAPAHSCFCLRQGLNALRAGSLSEVAYRVVGRGLDED